MSQNSLTLPTTGTVSGLAMTQNTNQALDTLNTLASGASAPSSPEAGQLWHDTTNNLLKIRSLDNTAWVPFLQLNESAYAALPFFGYQASGNLNRILNGAMDIDQVNEGASYTLLTNSTFVYTTDQWEVVCQSSTASGLTGQRVADAPPGFVNSLKVTVGTGAGSIGSNDNLQIQQPIEGVNLSDLSWGSSNAVPVSLSFWVKSSVTGTYSVLLSNFGGARTYVTTFSILSAGVWQKVTIANIPGDQSGTWPTNNTLGLGISIVGAAGSGVQTSTLNAWQSGAFIGANTQTNTLLMTSGATLQLTGVMFNAGIFSMPYEKRPVTQGLQACQRYYAKTFAVGTAVGQGAGLTGSLWFPQTVGASAGGFSTLWQLPVQMRASPTGTTYNPTNSNAQIRDVSVSSDWSSTAVAQISSNGVLLSGSTPGGSAAGHAAAVHITANARF